MSGGPANFDGAHPVIDPNDAAMLLFGQQSGLLQPAADPNLRLVLAMGNDNS